MASAAASRGARYGKDYRSFTITLTPEEHRECKRKAFEYDIPVTDVCRYALLDPNDDAWKKVAELKAKQREEKEGGE